MRGCPDKRVGDRAPAIRHPKPDGFIQMNEARLSLETSNKLYYKIGEVSEITDLPTHVLRFWENEFRRIHPMRTPAGQRLYRKKDIELILTIKELLYERKFTIEGAKRHLKATGPAAASPDEDMLVQIRAELRRIRDLLS
jgi:DNA-binding transcriptional MerR regulator